MTLELTKEPKLTPTDAGLRVDFGSSAKLVSQRVSLAVSPGWPHDYHPASRVAVDPLLVFMGMFWDGSVGDLTHNQDLRVRCTVQARPERIVAKQHGVMQGGRRSFLFAVMDV